MPNSDGTGPAGKGPMTGRGRGYCALRIPDEGEDPVRGFSGLSGKEFVVSAIRGKEVVAMPGRDRTGPGGMGPMTGWGAGYCGGRSDLSCFDGASRRGFRGRGNGRRGLDHRHRFRAAGFSGGYGMGRGPGGWRAAMSDAQPPATAPEREGQQGWEEGLEVLKAQAGHIEQVLEDIKSRIDKLESGSKSEPADSGATG